MAASKYQIGLSGYNNPLFCAAINGRYDMGYTGASEVLTEARMTLELVALVQDRGKTYPGSVKLGHHQMAEGFSSALGKEPRYDFTRLDSWHQWQCIASVPRCVA